MLVLLLTGCGLGPNRPAPTIPVSAPPTALASLPPTGAWTPFESATLSADSRVLTLHFVGGRPYDPSDPCSIAYAGWAQRDGDALDAAVVDVTPTPRNAGQACTAEGHERTVVVPLTEPFLGSRVADKAGGVNFVRQPEGLDQLHGLPSGWMLRTEGDVEDSPTGRWLRTYAPIATPDLSASKGHLDFYQSFGSPAGVSGGDSEQAVTVDGQEARLYVSSTDGELILVWMLGTNGLALDANAADFTQAELIKLAEAVTPGS